MAGSIDINKINESIKGLGLSAVEHLRKAEEERESKFADMERVQSMQILRKQVDGNLASEYHRRIIEMIEKFDANLDSEHEVGVRLVSFGQSITFHLRDMGFWNPSLITFTGETDEGIPVFLIQHVSQISILLLKLLRANPEEPKTPMGFYTKQADKTNHVSADPPSPPQPS